MAQFEVLPLPKPTPIPPVSRKARKPFAFQEPRSIAERDSLLLKREISSKSAKSDQKLSLESLSTTRPQAPAKRSSKTATSVDGILPRSNDSAIDANIATKNKHKLP